jgi:hypothetical protein
MGEAAPGQRIVVLGAADTGMLPIAFVLLDWIGSVGLGVLPSEDRVVPVRCDGDLCGEG